MTEQEERETRGQVGLRDSVNDAWRGAGRRPLGTIQELRAGENRRQCGLNAGFEIRLSACALVERQRRSNILIRHWATERAPRHRRQDHRRARKFVGGRLWMADEDALTARRLAQARWRER